MSAILPSERIRQVLTSGGVPYRSNGYRYWKIPEPFTIIVSGKRYVPDEQRNAFLARSREAMLAARGAPGCLDFIVAAS